MRLADADREEFYERLARHAAAGRLSIPELERRVAVVDAATTREEAAAVLVDLPPLPGGPARGGASRPRRSRGHGDAAAPAADWRPTAERFRDPRTGTVMRVWEDTAGGRHYVVDDDQA